MKKFLCLFLILSSLFLGVSPVFNQTAPSVISKPLPIDELYHWVAGMYVYSNGQWTPVKAKSDGTLYSDVSGSTITVTVPGTVFVVFTTSQPVNAFQAGSWNVTSSDNRYVNKISSGCISETITGITSHALNITDNVVSWSFKYKNTSDTEQYGEVMPSIFNVGPIKLADGDWNSEVVTNPCPIDFNFTNLSVDATMQIVIMVIK